MAEKTISKHLTNLENHFSPSNGVLKKACGVFHELDQLEYDLGLIDDNETVARKSSWWPTVSLIGGLSTAKSEFITRFFNSSVQISNHKFTVYQYTPQETVATLPGTALDSDYKLPFYEISHKIEQISTGEGNKINAYLELKTLNSDLLKNKLFINTPSCDSPLNSTVQSALTQHIMQMSDLVLVFTDLFDATPELVVDTIEAIIALQDSNKFIFVIDYTGTSLDSFRSNEIISSWQSRLAELGIYTGQFIVLSDTTQTNSNSAVGIIEQRLANIENDRSYRVLHSLEKGVRDINDVYIPEVESYLKLWKDRVNMTTLIIIGFIISLFLFAEISFGITDLLLDPIIGPAFLLVLIAFLLPTHLIVSKVHAKFIIGELQKQQKKLNITENLAGLFERSLTFWRIILPINEPVGKNKKTKKRTDSLIEQSKGMVQELNDQFSQQLQKPLFSSVSKQTNIPTP